MKNLYHRLTLLLALLLPMQYAWAQGVTTSSMTGTISDEKGGGLPGATIVAVHTPTGTRYGTTTQVDGRFIIPNMRVGGPYAVTVTFVGFQEQTFNTVTLRLAEPFVLNVKLGQSATQLNEVLVTGANSRSVLNGERTGSTTNIGRQEVERLPTITRSLNDFTRLTPQSSSNNTGAVGGGNFRQNNITVDGSDFNNNFGIGGNLPANGNPISLDAIEEVSVNLTPYDVRQSDFIGSSINAVTRSGTNEFSGSVYTYFRNQNQQGNKVGSEEFVKQDLQDKQYGFRIGGPIIKDKLFFFLNAEQRKQTSPGQANRASNPSQVFGAAGTPSFVVRPTEADLDSYSTYLKEKYGYETGPYQGYDFQTDRTNILGRLDWNISNNHRLSVRYSQVESKSPSFVSTSRSPLAAFSTTRTSNTALPFQNANYFQEANFYSFAAELNSSFGKYSNTLRATYTHQNDPRSSNSDVFPFVDILNGGTPYTSFGYEPFTFGNLRDVETYSVVDFTTFSLGKHNITAGLQGDIQSTKNGFQRFATSYYTFASWSDFANGVKPVDFAQTISLLPGYEQAFPRFKFAKYAAYAQDEYSVSDKLRLTAGVRLDLLTYLDVQEIQTHPIVANLTFNNNRKIDTGVLPDPKVMVSPRFGFNYDVKGDRTLQLRGGTGIFTGKVPTVWIVAQSGDAGLIQLTQTYETPTADRGTPSKYATPGAFNPDPYAYRPAIQPTPGTAVPSTLSTISPNFKFPQTWKTSLAVDAKLPGGLVGTLEGIYNKDLVVALGRNLNLVEGTPLNVKNVAGDIVYPDQRPIYPNPVTNKFINPLTAANAATNPSTPVANGNALGLQALNAIELYNRYDGYYWSITAKLEKQFSNGLFGSLAYVKSEQKVLFDGGGDQLLNTWSGTPIVTNSNDPELSYSSFVPPSRLVGAFSFKQEYIKHLATTISVFYEGSSAGRFSYIYGADFNRDGQTNDLIYVPKDATEITFTDFNYGTTAAPNTYTAKQQSDLFFRYIEQDEYLRTRKGKYAERNGAKYPWRNQFDVKLAQDLFVDLGDKRNSLQFTLDIFNVGNLINENWGITQFFNNASVLTPTNQATLVAGGTVKPTFRLSTDRNQPITSTFRNNVALASTYYMQFGFRYTFN